MRPSNKYDIIRVEKLLIFKKYSLIFFNACHNFDNHKIDKDILRQILHEYQVMHLKDHASDTILHLCKQYFEVAAKFSHFLW